MPVEDVVADAKSRLEAMIAPIGGGAGADVSFDETFDLVKAEVEKLQSLSGGKVDWASTSSNCEQILTDKGKDFRVALYYAAARAHIDGLAGLLDGFVLMQDLDAAFWDTMGPALKRPKARGNLCTWFSDLVAPPFVSLEPGPKDIDVVKALDQVSRAVDGDLRDKLGDHYGGMGAIRSAITNLVRALPKDAPKPPPPKPEVAKPTATAPVEASASAEIPVVQGGLRAESITNADAASDAIPEIALILARAGDALRAADPGNAVAYRITRAGMWLQLHQAPPADGGVTMVPAPPDGERERFESLAAAEDWLGLIAAADEAAGQYILWLDPHRYVANAMDRLGAIFLGAKKALLREVAYLLQRIPSLATLSFSDGTPFADGQTKMWLEAEVQPALGGVAASTGGGGVVSALDAPIAEARGLAASGKLSEAIDVVAKAAASAPTPAERFRGRLAIAKLCLQAEQFAIARAQLEGLDKLAVHHHLAEWEPDLCADLCAALYAAHRGLNGGDEVSPEIRARETSAFERLCQLDAGAALKFVSV